MLRLLHQPPWSFGFDSQTRGTRENRRTLCKSTGFLTGPRDMPLWRGVGDGGLLAGKRRRPAAEDGVPPSLQITALTHILLARSPAPYSPFPPRRALSPTAFSGPMARPARAAGGRESRRSNPTRAMWQVGNSANESVWCMVRVMDDQARGHSCSVSLSATREGMMVGLTTGVVGKRLKRAVRKFVERELVAPTNSTCYFDPWRMRCEPSSMCTMNSEESDQPDFALGHTCRLTSRRRRLPFFGKVVYDDKWILLVYGRWPIS